MGPTSDGQWSRATRRHGSLAVIHTPERMTARPSDRLLKSSVNFSRTIELTVIMPPQLGDNYDFMLSDQLRIHFMLSDQLRPVHAQHYIAHMRLLDEPFFVLANMRQTLAYIDISPPLRCWWHSPTEAEETLVGAMRWGPPTSTASKRLLQRCHEPNIRKGLGSNETIPHNARLNRIMLRPILQRISI